MAPYSGDKYLLNKGLSPLQLLCDTYGCLHVYHAIHCMLALAHFSPKNRCSLCFALISGNYM